MLPLDDTRGRCEDTEGSLSLACIGRLAECEEDLEQFWPRIVCDNVSV
jgi:hypothetical protein